MGATRTNVSSHVIWPNWTAPERSRGEKLKVDTDDATCWAEIASGKDSRARRCAPVSNGGAPIPSDSVSDSTQECCAWTTEASDVIPTRMGALGSRS